MITVKDLTKNYGPVRALRGVDFTIEAGATGGGSDGSFLASAGVLTLDGLGVEGEGAHALDEHVELDWLPARAALLTEIALRLRAPQAEASSKSGSSCSSESSS